MTVFGIVIFGIIGLIAAFVMVFAVVSSIYSLHITSRFVLCEDQRRFNGTDTRVGRFRFK